MPIAGSDQPWVIDHEQALLDADALGAHVVILDAIGHIEAIGVGHYLAERGPHGHRRDAVALAAAARRGDDAEGVAARGARRRALATEHGRSSRSATTR